MLHGIQAERDEEAESVIEILPRAVPATKYDLRVSWNIASIMCGII
jgi:hypothetical protein